VPKKDADVLTALLERLAERDRSEAAQSPIDYSVRR
jgi:hypothetical protein